MNMTSTQTVIQNLSDVKITHIMGGKSESVDVRMITIEELAVGTFVSAVIHHDGELKISEITARQPIGPLMQSIIEGNRNIELSYWELVSTPNIDCAIDTLGIEATQTNEPFNVQRISLS